MRSRRASSRDLDFGPNASFDYNGLRLRWFDYHLKGIDNGIMDEPPVRIFVMGDNVYRDEHEFPLARTDYQDFYLRAGQSGSADSLNDGVLSQEPPGDEAPDTYDYDPRDPNPSIGGDLFVQPNGARDHRPAEKNSLTYTTEALSRRVEVTGLPKIQFYASSSAGRHGLGRHHHRRAPERLLADAAPEHSAGAASGGTGESDLHGPWRDLRVRD